MNDFFNARYYTAPLMRFLSADPGNAGADATDPQTWNAYSYVRNNPLAFIDPSGMDICSDGSWASTCVTDSAPPELESVCWWCWEYGIPYPGSQPSQPSQPAQPPPSGQQPKQQANSGTTQRLACAAGFGQNHSIAAAFGAQNNFVANLFGGNAVSGLVNLGLFVSGAQAPTASQLASIPFKGAAQGIPVPPGNPGLSGAVGQARGAAVQGAVSGAYNAIAGVGSEPIELGITASGTVAAPVAQLSAETLTDVATGVGLAKFGLDLGTFLYGLTVACH